MKNEADRRDCRYVRDQRSKAEQDSEAQRRHLVINSLVDRKPAQTLKERGDMIKFGTAEDKSAAIF